MPSNQEAAFRGGFLIAPPYHHFVLLQHSVFVRTFAYLFTCSLIQNFSMRKKHLLCLLLPLLLCAVSRAQQTETKKYINTYGGDVELLNNYGELRNGVSERIFTVYAPVGDYYYLRALANRLKGEKLSLYLNGTLLPIIYPVVDGWQYIGSDVGAIKLKAGRNELRFTGSDLAVPMVEEISLTFKDPSLRAAPAGNNTFVPRMQPLRQQPGAININTDDGAFTERILPNPEGTYDHAVDTQYSYSHFSWIYLTAGTHKFQTNGSNVKGALAVFSPSNYAFSWSDYGSGGGIENFLSVNITQKGYYAIALRLISGTTPGSTHLYYNNNLFIYGATVGGRRLKMSTPKGGDLNHFTCKLTGAGADTRIMVTRTPTTSIRGYNDDYVGSGNWNWGYSSRIKKNFNGPDTVQYGFVCAYSPSTTGVCDIYLGNQNSNVYNTNYPEFPLHTADDAIMTAPSTGMYNCIAWSGGVTTNWIWPPHSLSTYSCTSANYLQCFDNFYSNNPVRYPGAWNYTRSGATYNNSVVDLWKQPAGGYQHASVRKPGNDHPHGYDWESKPGGTARTLHPRHALENVYWYGVVNDYYIPTGTFARMAGAATYYATDADAVKAGVAVFDKGILTRDGSDKLARLVKQVDAAFVREFNEKYIAWDKTKAAHATYSDPSMYCKNVEHEALAALGKRNPFACLVLVMDKFVNAEDHFVGDLLVALSKEKYGKLLDEVKAERLAKPTDEQGRHKLHGDHDNGVLYVEKILAQLDAAEAIKPVAEQVSVVLSPNPVSDRLTVKLTLTESRRVSIQASSAQTRNSRQLLKELTLAPGTYQYQIVVRGFAGVAGDIITVQVRVNGQLQTYKALVQ
jgi:hypothetical protein